MKVKGGFLMYLFIFLGLILGACLIIVAIMLFSPGTSIFGLEWVGENSTGTYTTYDGYFKEISAYDTVTINALEHDANGNTIGYGYYDVDIRRADRDAVNSNVVVENKIQGLAKTADKTEFSIKFEESEDGKALTINVVQINTWLASTGASKITLNIPDELNTSNVTFIVNTGSGSVDFGGDIGRDSEAFALESKALTATTESGSITLKELTTASNAINLKTTSGAINLHAESLTTREMSIESASGHINLPATINANTLTLATDKGIIDGGNINANLTLNTQMGVVRLGNVNGNVIGTERLDGTDVKLGTISGELGIPSARNVNLEALNVGGFVNIVTEGGRIYIGSVDTGLNSRTNITTTSGEIKVYVEQDNNQIINLTTKSGKITAFVASSSGNKNFTTENGRIDVTLSQSTSLDLISETKGKIVLNWDETNVSNNILYREIRGTDAFTGAIMKLKSNTGNMEFNRVISPEFN